MLLFSPRYSEYNIIVAVEKQTNNRLPNTMRPKKNNKQTEFRDRIYKIRKLDVLFFIILQ
jgi:hypothetical protein